MGHTSTHACTRTHAPAPALLHTHCCTRSDYSHSAENVGGPNMHITRHSSDFVEEMHFARCARTWTNSRRGLCGRLSGGSATLRRCALCQRIICSRSAACQLTNGIMYEEPCPYPSKSSIRSRSTSYSYLSWQEGADPSTARPRTEYLLSATARYIPSRKK